MPESVSLCCSLHCWKLELWEHTNETTCHKYYTNVIKWNGKKYEITNCTKRKLKTMEEIWMEWTVSGNIFFPIFLFFFFLWFYRKWEIWFDSNSYIQFTSVHFIHLFRFMTFSCSIASIYLYVYTTIEIELCQQLVRLQVEFWDSMIWEQYERNGINISKERCIDLFEHFLCRSIDFQRNAHYDYYIYHVYNVNFAMENEEQTK